MEDKILYTKEVEEVRKIKQLNVESIITIYKSVYTKAKLTKDIIFRNTTEKFRTIPKGTEIYLLKEIMDRPKHLKRLFSVKFVNPKITKSNFPLYLEEFEIVKENVVVKEKDIKTITYSK